MKSFRGLKNFLKKIVFFDVIQKIIGVEERSNDL